MTVAERIDKIRKMRDISKDALERAAGLSAGRICKWLSNHGSPSVDQLIRIADVLEVLPTDLLNETPFEEIFQRKRFSLASQRRILEISFRLGEERSINSLMRELYAMKSPVIRRRKAK
jgi:transcriptional regulator with XRE-family HTH domain